VRLRDSLTASPSADSLPADVAKQIESLEQQKTELEEQKALLEQQNTDLSDDAERLAQEMDESREAIRLQEEKISELQTKLDDQDGESEKADHRLEQEVKQAKREADGYRSEIEFFEEKLEEAGSVRRKLENEVSQLRRSEETLRDDVDRLTRLSEAQSLQLKGIEKAGTTSDETDDELRKMRVELMTLRTVEHDLQTAKKEADHWREKWEGLDCQILDKDQANSQLRKTIDGLQAHLAVIIQRLAEQEAVAAGFEDEVGDLKIAVETRDQELDAFLEKPGPEKSLDDV